MVRCKDDSIYTGITNDIMKRLAAHNSGTGARYTKTRFPVYLMALWDCENRSEASKLEYKYKQLSRVDKLKLIAEYEQRRKG